jgi:hypothetical protein
MTTPISFRSDDVDVRRRRAWLPATAAGLMAAAAASGGIGLITGGLELGESVSARLPLHSPVLAGLALLLWVAAPMSLAAAFAIVRSDYAHAAVVGAGSVLVVWIAIEASFIRTFSWLQPVCVAWAIALIALGERIRVTRAPTRRPHSGGEMQ